MADAGCLAESRLLQPARPNLTFRFRPQTGLTMGLVALVALVANLFVTLLFFRYERAVQICAWPGSIGNDVFANPEVWPLPLGSSAPSWQGQTSW